jgi:hypothetical protein
VTSDQGVLAYYDRFTEALGYAAEFAENHSPEGNDPYVHDLMRGLVYKVVFESGS